MSVHPYTIRRSRRSRAIRLTVHPSHGVKISAPFGISEAEIARFVSRHAPWIEKALSRLRERIVPLKTDSIQTSFHACNARAKKMLSERARFFAEKLGVKYERIAIKRTSTQWGSCSSKGNLNFHYKLLFLPENIIDYVVVHELCHLLHHNHSASFWKEVDNILPQYHIDKTALKRYAP